MNTAPKRTLMCILAHPDDETLGTGGTLAKYGRDGVDTYVVSATRGERGRFGDAQERPSLEEVGRVREKELRCAADKLGVTGVTFLDYIDGDVSAAHPDDFIAKAVNEIRSRRPQVVITFGPEGGYGHPDHIAVSQFTAAAILCAADTDYNGSKDVAVITEPHTVSKLYYMAWGPDQWDAYQTAFKRLVTKVDGVEREATPYPDWLITTRIDTSDHWETVWQAVQCHQTQIAIYKKLHELPDDKLAAIWGRQTYYRVMSIVNGGRERETDLFEGIE
ncbi:hypothetical protein GF377_04170 [candidate division GN15 bacterium]|nr:hypothetical protein [candidate division GN15 bacterium]